GGRGSGGGKVEGPRGGLVYERRNIGDQQADRGRSAAAVPRRVARDVVADERSVSRGEPRVARAVLTVPAGRDCVAACVSSAGHGRLGLAACTDPLATVS